jgi:hypothetical protein
MMAKVDISRFEYRDMFRREIKIGDYIVYGGSAGRSAVLRAGLVIELTCSKGKQWDGRTQTSDYEPKIRIKSWNNYRAERSYKSGAEASGRQKDVTLGFLDRLIVVHPDTVSDKVKRDLAGPVTDYFGTPL